MTPGDRFKSPLAADIGVLLAGRHPLPWYAGNCDDPLAAGVVYDARDDPVTAVDVWSDRPDEEASTIAQAIVLAMNAASGFGVQYDAADPDGRGSA